ncbi:MAG TPA: nuclear transport factor 2 family protein [Chloroflexota bacterium]|nr:nuclear transport factor 2 family protein [Chloroflexota bacterium]
MASARSTADIVRSSYEAFAGRDRARAEKALSDDFTFTSPYDDHIDKSTYFQRCWPYGDTIEKLEIISVMTDGDDATVVYEISPKDGAPFRNAERLRVEGGKIREVEVFFGALPRTTSDE